MADDERRTVAVLGTGIMGAAMARNLCRHGHTVRVWNRTRAKAEELAAAGATVAETPAEAVAGVDAVLTVLKDGPAVLDAMTAAASGLTEGTVWVQISTVGVEATDKLVEFAHRHGLRFVDAPVLGTRQPAEQGTLVVLAGAAPDLRETVRPLFDAIGGRTLWVADSGDGGAASRLKLVLNSWVFTLTHGVAEAMALADGLGVDLAQFVDAVTGGPLDNAYFQNKGAAIRNRDFSTSFSVVNAAKDTELILEAAAAAGVRTDVAEAGMRRFERAIAAGHGDEDMAASYLADDPPSS